MGFLLSALMQVNHNYSEPTRPQFHFTAESGWLNDPNGLCFYHGLYHLFFQYRPLAVAGGDMAWGHAVSKDLIHWKQLSPAIEGNSKGAIWSGSAVVDWHNSSGLGTKNNPPMVCFFTAAGGLNPESKGQPFTQCAVYSNDGLTFHWYKGNPIIGHIIGSDRDPKVVWYEPTKSWILALYLDGNDYGLFGSTNLKTWKKLSEINVPNAGECPDFFPIALDGKKSQTKWVFWTAPGLYEVGSFDGKSFEPETGPIRSNYGNTSYAAQTFSDEPHGRRVQISWMRGTSFPGAAWDQQMSIPRELRLVTTPAGPQLTFQPVTEVAKLHKSKLKIEKVGNSFVAKSPSGLFDLEGTFDVGPVGEFNLEVHGLEFTYDPANQTFSGAGCSARLPVKDGKVELRILVDRATIEVFAQHGLIDMPIHHLVPAGADSLDIKVSDGCKLSHLSVYDMKSAWNPQP